MVKALHIAQDKYGYWFFSAEHADGTLDLREVPESAFALSV